MSTTPATTPPNKPSFARWAVIGIFSLLSLAFFARMLQYGWLWLSGAKNADLNYKALTVWCVIYVLVCGGIAAFAYWGFKDDGEVEPVADQNAERGT